MRTLAILTAGIAVLLFTVPALLADTRGAPPVRFGSKDKDKEEKPDKGKKATGGSKFGEDEKEGEKKKEEEKLPDKPVPLDLSTHDYRLDLHIEDSRFWKIDRKYSEDDEKKGVCLKMSMKLPKSDDYFDVRIFCQAVEHKMKLSWKDGTEIGASNYKAIATKHYEDDLKEWKEIRDEQKPKKTKLSRDLGKVYTYGFTGLAPGSKFPLHKDNYYFKFKDKTYILSVLFTTTSYKNKAVREAVEKILKSFKERKKKRGRR